MRKLLRRVAFLGVLTLFAAAVFHQYTLIATSTALAPAGIRTVLAGAKQWLRGATAHLTTTQILEGAGLAWFIFVLALVLLARSGKTDSRIRATEMKMPDERGVTGAVLPQQAQVSEATTYSKLPSLPLSHAHNDAPVDYLEVTEPTGDTSHGYLPSSPATVPVASDVLTEQRVEPVLESIHPSETRNRQMLQSCRSHMVALTGIARADGQLVPYGLFMVAEDVGTSQSAGTASRRAVGIISEEIAPSLASSSALGSAQLAALLKMAVMRASLDLREQGIRTATPFEAAVTGVMVIGDIVHVVNVGDCRTYVFRPSAGLLQITTDHSVISCLVDSGLLQPDALYQHPRRDQVYRSVGGSQAATEIDAFEIRVHADDVLLLCSPGLWQALRLPQIETVLRATPDPRSAAARLSREGASHSDGNDFSIIVVRPLDEWMPRFGISDGHSGHQ